MKLHYATTNPGKFHSLQKDFQNTPIELIQVPLDLPEPRSADVQEIAHAKIVAAYKQIQQPVVVLDAGFYIFSLNGFPKAYVNFALETIGIKGILKLAAGKVRHCEFRECFAYLAPGLNEPHYFFRRYPGTLATAPSGQMAKHLWSPLSLIFIPEESTKTLGAMTKAEYAAWEEIVKQKQKTDEQFDEWFLKNLNYQK